MAILTEQQLIDLRKDVGDNEPSDEQLQAIYDRLGSLDLVVLEVLERRLATLEATPTQFSIPGEYSQNTSDNLAAVRARLGTIPGGPGAVRIHDADLPQHR